MSALLSVQDLSVHFPVMQGALRRREVARVKAVDGVSFDVAAGEVVGLVGESGCGKSTTGRAIMQLQRPTAGRVMLGGVDLTALSPAELGPQRRRMAMVFQDPFGSLNPRMTVGDIIAEPLRSFGLLRDRAAIERRVADLMERCGLDPRYRARHPHAFSGGQRQRIGIARALAGEPDLLVCDEPVSALDVSIQAQILNLLKDLQRDLGLACVFIAHDLAAVRHLCDRVVVMYLGRVAEVAPAADLFARPQHPYTRALLSAVPVPDPAIARPDGTQAARTVLRGEVPSPLNPPPGCAFHPRCPALQAGAASGLPCASRRPMLAGGEMQHQTACWLVNPPET